MLTYSKHTEWERRRDSRSVSMAATELLVFLLHWVGCLPDCLPACLSACLSLCLSVCLSICLSAGTGMIHRAGNRDRMQRLAVLPDETPSSLEANTTRTLCPPVTSCCSSTFLTVSHISLSEAFFFFPPPRLVDSDNIVGRSNPRL